jgi:hypothetical protein
VLSGIATRLTDEGRCATRIIVDQQKEFNDAQQFLQNIYVSAKNAALEHPPLNPPGMPKINFLGMPITPLSFTAGQKSAGLELVDIYLWIFKRAMEKKELSPKLYSLITPHLQTGNTDEISLNAISKRWNINTHKILK